MTSIVSPLVSVAILTYNSSKFIAEAINSALEQGYSNIEIVISDDASTDDTMNIVHEYARNYPDKIRVLANEINTGPVNNWFKCIWACRGKYIVALAGDDKFLPSIIAKQVAIMENDPNNIICYTDASVFDVYLQKELYCLSDKRPPLSGGIGVALSDAIYYSPTSMFRSEFRPKENIFATIRYGADLAFYKEVMILAGNKGKINYIPEVLYVYQKHGSNITETNSIYRTEHIDAIKLLQAKYPAYASLLNSSIYDFCCVGFCKTILKAKFKESWFFLKEGMKAANGNPFKFFRALLWALKYKMKMIRLK